jgi:serine/threonine protein kinase
VYRLTECIESAFSFDLFRAEVGGRAVLLRMFREAAEVAHEAPLQTLVEEEPPFAAEAANVLSMLESGFIGKRLALVYEDVGALPLSLLFRRPSGTNEPLSLSVAMAVIIDLVECLDSLHQKGVAHGLLTADSVWVDVHGALRISDTPPPAVLVTHPKTVALYAKDAGSALAPEWAAQSGAPTVASDVYSVGALLYCLLTGRSPQRRSSVTESVNALIPPSHLVRRVSAQLDAIVLRALEPQSGRRYLRVSDIGASLRGFLQLNGGLPSRQDVGRFVYPLLIDATKLSSGVLPTDQPLTLFSSPTDAAGPIPQASAQTRETEPELEARKWSASPDSDWDTPLGLSRVTSLQLPLESAKTEVVRDGPLPPLPSPPPAIIHPARQQDEPSLSVLSRIRPKEDFEALKAEPTAIKSKMAATKSAKTKMTFATPFRRDTVDAPSQFELRKRRSLRHAKIAAVVGTLALLSGVAVVVGYWWVHTSDKAAAVLSSIPAPVVPLVEAAARRLPSVEVPAPENQPPKTECYQAPRGKSVAFVQFRASAAVTVFIDGATLCTPLSKVALAPGAHDIRATHLRSKRTFESKRQFEAGKTQVLNLMYLDKP